MLQQKNSVNNTINAINSKEALNLIDKESRNLKEEDNLDDQVKKTMEILKQKREEKESKLLQNKTRFAGEEFVYEKEMTEKDLKLIKQQEKNKTHKELDSLVDQITTKKEINIFDKTKVDWKKYVEKNNLSKDLDYTRKDGFLEKKRFIEETNYKLMQHKKEEERKHTYLTNLNNKKKNS